MIKYALKRFGASVIVMFLASLLLYFLVTHSGDPLRDLRESNDPNREMLMQRRIDFMNLDQPWFLRYLSWLGGVAGCFVGRCDLGTTRNGVQVSDLLANAASSTLRLVVLATVLAIIIGIAVGIVTAIRQYSGLDYAITFLTFLFFSLPVFWAAVLLKEYIGIAYNDWLRYPQMNWVGVGVLAVILGLALQAAMGGNLKRRLMTGIGTAIFFFLAVLVMNNFNLFMKPSMGPFGIGIWVLAAAVAVGATALVAGIRNKQVLVPALVTAGIGIISYYATFTLLEEPNWFLIVGLFVLAIVIAVVVARLLGGWNKGAATSVSVVTAIFTSIFILADHIFRAWEGFLRLKPRPISTIGSQTPNFAGNFWEDFLDKGMQMLLPTILLTIISIATYSRYTRASMLEVSQQDYIRTARSKGLNERSVILKHAFRNTLIPITTIVAFDFAGLIGGAVVTERVFGWKGMGELFQTGLQEIDPIPVMAFFLITGTAAVFFNLIADLMYAVLDPRIRL